MFDFAEETVVLERRPQADSLLLESKTRYPRAVDVSAIAFNAQNAIDKTQSV